MTRKRKGNGQAEPFVMHYLDTLESTAWRSLTLGARLVLDRLEIEHMRRHGAHNGKLIVTYDQFLAHMGWNRRASVAAAIQQLERLGFLEVVERGKWNDGKDRRASRYRLNYLPTRDKPPTDEWLSSVPQGELRNNSPKGTTDF
jgi:hypothetical protein